MKWLVAHWGESKRSIFERVGSALRARGDECAFLPRNELAHRAELLTAISSRQYGGLLTWQRFYPGEEEIRRAVSATAMRTIYMDYGFMPHYQSVVFDPVGENGSSSWPRLWQQLALFNGIERQWCAKAARLVREQTAGARLLPRPVLPELEGLRYPFVFLPLQRSRDAVVRFDSKVQDLGSLVQRVLWLARGRFFVVCKTHPLEPGLTLGVPDRLNGSHAVVRTPPGPLNDQLCQFLLSRAALVVGVNSSLLFQAVIQGKPTIATGRGWFSGSGAVHEVDGVSCLHALDVPAVHHDAQLWYLAFCLSRQLTFEELETPEHCLNLLERLGAFDSK